MQGLARLPIFLALAGKRALVAGNGAPVAWKAELLAAAGADVAVFAERPCEELRTIAAHPPRAAIALQQRAWRIEDFAGAAVAVGGFEDAAEAERFSGAARAAGVPVNVIDRPAYCDFSFGAIVNRSPLVIGISTDGAAPVFAQAIRAKLETMIPRGFARWADAARRWRQAVQLRGFRRLAGGSFGVRSRPLRSAIHSANPRHPISMHCCAEPRTRPPPPKPAASRWSAPARAMPSCSRCARYARCSPPTSS
jgi:uroporphyrin-III C-methyltransferase/precorrin-2 dehydrogenase/sirohydrochlorin ferrochelatase